MAPGAISPQIEAGLDVSSLTTVYHDTLRFFLNGTRVVVDEIDPEVTLLEYLRGIGLTGTKLYVRHRARYQLVPATKATLTNNTQRLCGGWVWCLHSGHQSV